MGSATGVGTAALSKGVNFLSNFAQMHSSNGKDASPSFEVLSEMVTGYKCVPHAPPTSCSFLLPPSSCSFLALPPSLCHLLWTWCLTGGRTHLLARNLRNEGWLFPSRPELGPTSTHTTWCDVMMWAILSGNHQLAELVWPRCTRPMCAAQSHPSPCAQRRGRIVGGEGTLLPSLRGVWSRCPPAPRALQHTIGLAGRGHGRWRQSTTAPACATGTA